MVERFVLQWHLGESCNLRCLHCYQENHVPVQLEFEKLERIYCQFKVLLENIGMKGHINLIGGEPLCNPYLFRVLDLIKEDSDLISFSILTNGTLLTREMADRISVYNPYYVQVSLEGGKRVNDFIRGNGTYRQIGDAIRLLREAGIFTSVSFTANSLNYREFPKVVKYARKCGANSVWSDRFIPLGGSKDSELMLSFEQTRKYLEIMEAAREKEARRRTRVNVVMNRALQFQMTDDFAYGCTAGDTLLTVMENGDLVPCRRMPIVVGNLLDEDMWSLYEESKVLRKLRDKRVPEECSECEQAETCRGGLKCLSYAICGEWDVRDMGCDK